jgi:glycerol-3-phosphate dehydrogenase
VTSSVTEHDVLGTWAGLRPLVKSAASGRTTDLSRRHKVDRSPSNVVTVTGGKLTTYRRMGADTVDEVMEALGRKGRSHTSRLKLVGAEGYVEPEVDSPATHLAGRYGNEADELEALMRADERLALPLVEGLPYARAEAVFAARHEMATTLDDVLSRRTRARLLARDDSAAAAPDVAALLGPELGWDAAEQERQVKDYRAAVAFERTSAGLPETALDAALGA